MQPLSGIRVLDLSRLLPGPLATMVLGDLGAAVDKIEDPHGGDYLRAAPPLASPDSDDGAIFRRAEPRKTERRPRPEGRSRRRSAPHDPSALRRSLRAVPTRRPRAPRPRSGCTSRGEPSSHRLFADGLRANGPARPEGGSRSQLSRARWFARHDRPCRWPSDVARLPARRRGGRTLVGHRDPWRVARARRHRSRCASRHRDE